MILQELKNVRGRVPFACDHCFNLGYKRKATINQYIKLGWTGLLFCSKTCQHLGSRQQKITTKCKNCHKAFEIMKSGLNEKGNFCSKSCAATYNNSRRKHSESTKEKIKFALTGKVYDARVYSNRRKEILCAICQKVCPYIRNGESSLRKRSTTCSPECQKQRYHENSVKAGIASSRVQVRRSKDEIRLYDLVKTIFPKAEHNVPVINKWDADIILRDEKIAIMWNGIWHREQLSFQNHSLAKVQNRDRIKIKEFIEAGWTVLVYEDNEWKPETAFENFKEILLSKASFLVF